MINSLRNIKLQLHQLTKNIWFKNFALYNKQMKAKFSLPNFSFGYAFRKTSDMPNVIGNN